MMSILWPTAHGSVLEMDLVVYPDGMTHVSAILEPDPQSPVFQLDLPGDDVDNFVATGRDNVLLSSSFDGSVVTLDTFDSDILRIEYDIHDLVSKDGRIWTFTFDAADQFTLLMPPQAIIVGLSTIPLDADTLQGANRLDLPGGMVEINYILEMSGPATTELADTTGDILTGVVIASAVAGVATAFVIMYRRRMAATEQVAMVQESLRPEPSTPEEIFLQIPDMRDDDKDIVRYIAESGGEVMERDLRNKFLMPRTTMWRAVKRLERLGVVDVSKHDAQNLVRMRSHSEDLS